MMRLCKYLYRLTGRHTNYTTHHKAFQKPIYLLFYIFFDCVHYSNVKAALYALDYGVRSSKTYVSRVHF